MYPKRVGDNGFYPAHKWIEALQFASKRHIYKGKLCWQKELGFEGKEHNLQNYFSCTQGQKIDSGKIEATRNSLQIIS